ncbi:MAG TPA: hypothetical protein VG754_11320 [Verrucomicrobiae bacterium]|nr:hypothetical protein [Verrucomicrobiae bacterium]
MSTDNVANTSLPHRLIAKIKPAPTTQTWQFRGFPPDLTGNEETREKMPLPCLLVIEEKPDGVFLFRYKLDGQCVGDTWHESVKEAQEQASFEYQLLSSEWKSIPPEIDDVVSFGLKYDAT